MQQRLSALRLEDLRVDEFRTGHHYTVRVTHLPTGLVAECDQYEGRLRNKIHALRLIQEALDRESP